MWISVELFVFAVVGFRCKLLFVKGANYSLRRVSVFVIDNSLIILSIS